MTSPGDVRRVLGTVETGPFMPVRLTPDLFRKAAEMSARAFFADPMGAYWSPDESKRMARLTRFFHAMFKHAHGRGQTYTTPGDPDGVAVWFAPGGNHIPLWPMLMSGLLYAPFTFGWTGLRNYLAMSAVDERVQAQYMNSPHWYLSQLCTDPSKQRQGIASALIRPVLDRADESGVPCYLETLTEKNVQFYSKRGFSVVWEGVMPRGGPRSWAMRREPR